MAIIVSFGPMLFDMDNACSKRKELRSIEKDNTTFPSKNIEFIFMASPRK